MRSGPGEARTILLLHIIRVRPSKQPLTGVCVFITAVPTTKLFAGGVCVF